ERRRAIADDRGITMELYNMGAVLTLGGDAGRARPMLREALERARDARDDGLSLYALIGLAGVAAADGDPATGARLLGAAAAGLEARGEVLDPAEALEQEQIEHALRERLGDERLAAERAAGRELGLDEAIAEA